jgi:hypothetical protein
MSNIDQELTEDIDVAAQPLLDAICAEAIYRSAGRDFLDAAAGIDRGALARRTAELLRERMRTKPPLLMAERAIWRDLESIFGWTHVVELRSEGRA